MSPEQCLGRKADPRSDIYSLGCIIYEILTEAPPLVADNPIGLMHKHTTENPASLVPLLKDCQQSQELIQALDAVLQKSMAKVADNRYQSADALKNDLLLLHRDSPQSVSAKPGQTPRPGKGHRTKLAIIAGGSIACLILATLIWKQQSTIISVLETRSPSVSVGSLHARILQVSPLPWSRKKLELLTDLLEAYKRNKKISDRDLETLYRCYMETLVRESPLKTIEVGKAALADMKRRRLGNRAIANINALMCSAYGCVERFPEAEACGLEAQKLFYSWPVPSYSEVSNTIWLARALSKTNKRSQALAILRQELNRTQTSKATFGCRIAAAIALLEPQLEPEMFALCYKNVSTDGSDMAATELLDCWQDLLIDLPNDKLKSRLQACLALIESSNNNTRYRHSLCSAATYLLASDEPKAAKAYLLEARKRLPSPEDSQSDWLSVNAGLAKANLISGQSSTAEISELCSLSAWPDAANELAAVALVAIDTNHFSQADQLIAAIDKDSNSRSSDPQSTTSLVLSLVARLQQDQLQRKTRYLQILCSFLEKTNAPVDVCTVAQSELAVNLVKSEQQDEAKRLIKDIEAKLASSNTQNWQCQTVLLNLAMCARLQGNAESAMHWIDKAIQTADSAGNSTNTQLRAAFMCIELHRRKRAIQLYESIIQHSNNHADPNYSTAARYLGGLYSQEGQREKSLKILKTVVIPQRLKKADDSSAPFLAVLNSLAAFYAESGDFKSSFSTLDQSIRLAKETGKSYAYQLALKSDFVRGIAGLSTSERSVRVADFLNAAQAQLSEKTPPAERNFVKLRQALNLDRHGKLQEALKLLNELVKEYDWNESEMPRGYLTAAKLNLKAGDAVAARALAASALKRTELFGNDAETEEIKAFLLKLDQVKPSQTSAQK